MHKLLAAFALTAAAGPPAERVVGRDDTVTVTIANLPVRLAIDPGAPGMPIVSQRIVDAAGLACSGLLCFGVAYNIGRVKVAGRSGVFRIGWQGEVPSRRRVGWMTPPHTVAGDGTVGPGGLPDPVVRFVLGPARAGERTAALPIEGNGLLANWGAMRGVLTLGDDKIAVRFDPTHRRSLVTAAAGVAIARAQGGIMTPERGQQEILFGVERPYQVMSLSRPLAVGPLTVASLGVRSTDGSGANTIPQEGDDPSEVVVNAKGKKTYMVLSLGADALARCSSLVFDKPAKVIRLTCA